MKKIPFKLATVLVAAFALPAQAAEIAELENNHPVEIAQPADKEFPVSSGITIPAQLGPATGDVDYYAFSAVKGQDIDLDIDGGYIDRRTAGSVNLVMAVFGPDLELIDQVDDVTLAEGETVDEGSVDVRDPYIKFTAEKTGRYIVGVSNAERTFLPGGRVDSGTFKGGTYTLNITGVAPAVKRVAIKVKPGNNGLTPVTSRGKIPVAILGAEDFKVADIDLDTLTFGSTGYEVSLFKCDPVEKEVSNDIHIDRVCHFDMQRAGFGRRDLEGTLRGKTKDGADFEGTGYLKVIPLPLREEE